MKLKNTFQKRRLNRDADERLVPKGEFIDALNINVSEAEGLDVGAIENSLGNKQLTAIDLGTGVYQIGEIVDENQQKIYWLTKSDTACHVLEWDNVNKVLFVVLKDSRTAPDNVLNFDENYLVEGINIIADSDNDVRFLAWTDGLNEPRKINIEEAKKFEENGFSEEDISLIKAPPLDPPTLVFKNTPSGLENNLEEKLLFFSYRYRYQDNEYSALSPFSRVGFEPKAFDYDFSITTNKSMVNKYNSVEIQFNTGPSRVKGIDLMYKESRSSNVYLIESFDKEEEDWSDNTTSSFTFINDKSYTNAVVAESEVSRLYDNVPRKAVAQEVIGNRLVYGNYTENYSLVDDNGDSVIVDMRVDYNSYPITSGPVPSMKSNRDEEVGIVYLDSNGRMTSVLTSKNNTTFIKNEDADSQNKLTVTIANKPPSFASKYRFFIKKAIGDYDTITPLLFYRDGTYVWVRIEGNDEDKISKGDFIYVKADSEGVLSEAQAIEVLDLKEQGINFLEADPGTTVIQQAGTYIKIKASKITLDEADIRVFEESTKGFKSRKTDNDITSNVDYLEPAVYYGTDGLDDLTGSVAGGGYSSSDDLRYEIEMQTLGTPDQFRWRTINANDGTVGSWTNNVDCTLAATALVGGFGIETAFGATTGHDLEDRWVLSAKALEVVSTRNSSKRAWVPYRFGSFGDENIIQGAVINITYKEERDFYPIQKYTQSFVSGGNYDNAEEWFFEENIIDELEYPTTLDRVVFRRGNAVYGGDLVETIDIDAADGDLWMLFQSESEWVSGDRIRVMTQIEVQQLSNYIIFETIPKEEVDNLYFEWGDTYDITNGLHMGKSGDVDQTSTTEAVIELQAFNCFAWGNGYESYKIKDKFTGDPFRIDTRPSININNYRENKRIASLTYSSPYEQTTNYNGLNEFNLSLVNHKDLDDKYGKINKLFTRDTNLIVWQEDKVHNIMFQKSVLFNADGSGNVSQNLNVLGQEVPYAGEYGISGDARGFAYFGNNMWWPDSKRGVICRLGADGITEVSNYGMRNFFRELLADNVGGVKVGGYDPFYDQYVLTIKEDTSVPSLRYPCESIIFKKDLESAFTYTVVADSNTSTYDIGYDVAAGGVDISVTHDGTTTSTGPVSGLGGNGLGTLTVNKTNSTIDEATVVITPTSSPATVKITNGCTKADIVEVIIVVIAGIEDGGNKSGVIDYKIGGVASGRQVNNFSFYQSGVTVWNSEIGTEGNQGFPEDQDSITLETFYSNSADDAWSTANGNKMGWFISTTKYTPSQIVGTVLPLTTFETVTSTVEGGGIRHVTDPFVYTKSSDDEILYFIYDFRDTVVTAVDDPDTGSFDVYQNDIIIVNVLDNDTYVGTPTVTITSAPTRGTAIVNANNNIRYKSDGTIGTDTITYQLSDQFSSDTANVNLNVIADDGGGTGANGKAFDISNTGYTNPNNGSDGQGACDFTLTGTLKYHNGPEIWPILDDLIYNEIGKTTLFDGENKYWKIEGGKTIKINPSGRVVHIYTCENFEGGIP